MRYALCVMGYGLCVMRYALCVMGYALWVMGYALCVMRYGLWVMRYALSQLFIEIEKRPLHYSAKKAGSFTEPALIMNQTIKQALRPC